MSLTKFIRRPEIAKRLAAAIKLGRYGWGPDSKIVVRPSTLLALPSKPLQAKPETQNYALVGTAFDYLLRFYLACLNPNRLERRRWVAESAIRYCVEEEVLSRASEILQEARGTYREYLEKGQVNRDLMGCCLLLAQMDGIFRSGGDIPPDLGFFNPKDVDDLEHLISIVDPVNLRAERHCVLNPAFGRASKLVGGADADIIVDGTLIEIKTVQQLLIRPKYIHQLIGYYLLSLIGGIDSAPDLTLERVGIYFSRYGYLFTAPIHSIVDEDELPELRDWFEHSAKELRRPSGRTKG